MSQLDVKSEFTRNEPVIIECCQSCRYYKPYPASDEDEPEEDDEEDADAEDAEYADDYSGVCRRYPPRIFPGITPISVYPDVSGRRGWCGEYMPGL